MTGRAARSWPRRGDGGNAALELVILTPVIVLLISMVVAAGRVAIAQGSIDAAARDAARQASLARSPAQAQAAALDSAIAELSGEDLTCTPTVTLPGLAAAFGVPAGQPSTVRARVTCTVSLSDLLVPGLPGHRRLTGTFTSPLDPFRGRSDGSEASGGAG